MTRDDIKEEDSVLESTSYRFTTEGPDSKLRFNARQTINLNNLTEADISMAQIETEALL